MVNADVRMMESGTGLETLGLWGAGGWGKRHKPEACHEDQRDCKT